MTLKCYVCGEGNLALEWLRYGEKAIHDECHKLVKSIESRVYDFVKEQFPNSSGELRDDVLWRARNGVTRKYQMNIKTYINEYGDESLINLYCQSVKRDQRFYKYLEYPPHQQFQKINEKWRDYCSKNSISYQMIEDKKKLKAECEKFLSKSNL